MKRFKDPIYGYIDIPDEVVDIIDTAAFQRLRSIIQTSYAPLYASAVHNRFVQFTGHGCLEILKINAHVFYSFLHVFWIEMGNGSRLYCSASVKARANAAEAGALCPSPVYIEPADCCAVRC